MELTIVTWNGEKFKRISSQLPDFVIPKQVDLDLPEIQTNLLTVISRDKCIKAYRELLTAVLVDDTWIFFTAFKNFPGALAKFVYEGMWLDGMQKLFENLENKWAYMQCVLSYMDGQLEEPMQFVADTKWTISFDWHKSGEENVKLPFEGVFIPNGSNKPASLDQERWLGPDHHRVRSSKMLGERLSTNRK